MRGFCDLPEIPRKARAKEVCDRQRGGLPMEPERVRRFAVAGSVLILSVVYVLTLSCPLRAQGTKRKTTTVDRPGDAPYAPTKLEWAALELQAGFGSATWSNETPVITAYVATGDGATIRCIR